MFRKFVLAAALAAGGFAAAPTDASAGNLSIGVGFDGPGYYGGYEPVYHRGYRHRWRERPYYGYYAPRPRYYGGGYRRDRPRCRTVTVRSWNGYRYVTRVRETCGRRYY